MIIVYNLDCVDIDLCLIIAIVVNQPWSWMPATLWWLPIT